MKLFNKIKRWWAFRGPMKVTKEKMQGGVVYVFDVFNKPDRDIRIKCVPRGFDKHGYDIFVAGFHTWESNDFINGINKALSLRLIYGNRLGYHSYCMSALDRILPITIPKLISWGCRYFKRSELKQLKRVIQYVQREHG